MQISPFGQRDHFFMQEAFKEAQTAYAQDEVPIGAVVVNADGDIIGCGHNLVETTNTQCAHAEVIAIEQAGKTTNDWRLDGCWLYVTLERCTMCMMLARLSRLSGIVYGADSPLFGYRLDKIGTSRVYKENTFVVVPNVCAEQAATLLKCFFQKKRKESE